MQVKIFAGSDPGKIEKEINDWFNTYSSIEVDSIKQSESSDSEKWCFTISIFYRGARAIKPAKVQEN